MNVSEALKAAGFTPEKSTAGDKPIFIGTYKATLFDVAEMADKGYGASIYAQFKIQETLEGRESKSQFPEFKEYFSIAPDKIASKKKGLAKLINGFFSVGIDVDTTNLMESLTALKGSAVFISGFAKEPRKQNEAGEWVENPDGETKQGFAFLTEKNAMKRVKTEPAAF